MYVSYGLLLENRKGQKKLVYRGASLQLEGSKVRDRVQGRSDGGYIGIYTPKSVYRKFFMWLFCLLDPYVLNDFEIAMTIVNIYTHPNQIPDYATDRVRIAYSWGRPDVMS